MGLFTFGSKKADQAAPEPAAEKQPGFFARMRAKLNRGDSWLTYDLANLLPGGKIDDAVLDELEMRLIGADVGMITYPPPAFAASRHARTVRRTSSSSAHSNSFS